MKYIPQHLQLYKRPDCYAGPDYYDYYVFLGQSRDSSCLEQSNFRSGLKAIGGEKATGYIEKGLLSSQPVGPVIVIRDRHWAVGWVETIYIHKTAYAALKKADKIADELESYPVVDEFDFSELETEEQSRVWMNCYSLRERIALCAENGISIFAARRSYPPCTESGECVVSVD